ncbi:hypothetical protein [Sphingopyxis sp.]|uniref:hypothetical protein n=1 Tax=Sphingopyxis sp. TaxID=1908224 RepID=UPI003BA89D73
MTLIDNLGRNRMSAWLAWMAVLSLGLLATGGVRLGINGLEDRPVQSTIRALEDAPPHIIRVASTKLTAHRPNIDDDRPTPGSDPAMSTAGVGRVAIPAAASVLLLALAAPIVERAGSPYAARAPPASII